jgi:hypothetical protein
MRIEYIFIRFLHFMSYNSFKQKLSFELVKNKRFFKGEEKKTFWNDFFFFELAR